MQAVMRRMMRIGISLCAMLSLLIARDAAAQAVFSETRARALPRNEFAFGIDQWQYAPDSGDPSGGSTRWGLVLASRGSLLGQWNLGEQEGALRLGDYLETGVGFYGATGTGSLRQSPVLRLPMHYGLQLGKLTAGGTQLVGRAGYAAGLSATAYAGPFIGARVKHRAVGVESSYIMDSEGSNASVLLRWYPRTSMGIFNVALRYERQRYEPTGAFSLTKGASERSLMLLFSGER